MDFDNPEVAASFAPDNLALLPQHGAWGGLVIGARRSGDSSEHSKGSELSQHPRQTTLAIRSRAPARQPRLSSWQSVWMWAIWLQTGVFVALVSLTFSLDAELVIPWAFVFKFDHAPWPVQMICSTLRILEFIVLAAWIRGRLRRRAWRRTGSEASQDIAHQTHRSAWRLDPDSLGATLAASYAQRISRSLTCPLDAALLRSEAQKLDRNGVPVVFVSRVQPDDPDADSGDSFIPGQPAAAVSEPEDLLRWESGRPFAVFCVAAASLFGLIIVGFILLSSRRTALGLNDGLWPMFSVVACGVVMVLWAAAPPAGLAPFRLSSCIARPGGVSYAGWFRRLEFTPADTLLLIEGQWHGLTLITFIRTDGAWKRLTVDQSGLDHLLGCWRLPGPEALPDKLQEGPRVR